MIPPHATRFFRMNPRGRPEAGGLGWLLAGCLLIGSAQLGAAGNVLIPGDTNSRITVENAVVEGERTTVFFLTWPYLGDPDSGKPCPLNYYAVTLQPGLPGMPVETVAKGVCSSLFQKSRLLDDGDALLIVGDRLERWRQGERVDSRAFSAIDAISALGVSTALHGGQLYAISPAGDVVLAVHSDGGGGGQAELVAASLRPDTTRRWEARIGDAGQYTAPDNVWAGNGGSALIQLNRGFAGTQLQVITADGSRAPVDLSAGEADPASLVSMTPEEAQRFLRQQQEAKPESIKRVAAQARDDGGFDVLFQRRGGGPGREGHFLFRLDAQGRLQADIPLGGSISEYGLDDWHDFYLEDGQLVLLSRAAVTQKVVNGVRKGWGQNIVSRVDLETGTPDPRLIPLDGRYLEAALSAGDEGVQYLDGHPGSEPALLTRLGGQPLVVSIGWLSRRQALRVHEADPSLPAFTEVIDEQRTQAARDAARAQRRSEREAMSERLAAAEAAAAGMSEEEYAALSNREQQEALIRNGGTEQLMQAMMQESQALQASGAAAPPPGQPAAGQVQDMNAQLAAAMAQAQAQMASDPNITPEMRAQMEAVFAQMGQPPGAPAPAASAAPAAAAAVPDDEALRVDAAGRGLIEFDNRDGGRTTLLIYDRRTGEALMSRTYADGMIRESVDFSAFQRPLQQIGVMYRDVAGMVLKDLTPVVRE